MSLSISEFDPADFSMVVKYRGLETRPWRWEIYRAGNARAIQKSPEFFATMSGASRAGKLALKELLDQAIPLIPD